MSNHIVGVNDMLADIDYLLRLRGAYQEMRDEERVGELDAILEEQVCML